MAPEPEEVRLIARSREGDRPAQELLVRRCQDEVYRLAFHLLGDAEDALDAAQEALVAMLCSLHSFRGEANFHTWLYRLTTNICLMQRRRESVRTRLVTNMSAEPYFCFSSQPDPESLILNLEAQSALRQHLRQLAPEFRAVLVLREIEGLSYHEIAQIVRVPVGTVRSRLSRGRRLLRAALLADERLSSLRPRGEKT
jgi:RNA polymerase sigma-70 factor (ECF subfamily)